MLKQDVRWQQRLKNFSTALVQLESAVSLAKTRKLSDLEKLGTIQTFEYSHELAWKAIKDYFEYQGKTSISGARDATSMAIQNSLIEVGDVWMEMIENRNKTSQSYNQRVANEIVAKIQTEYFQAFKDFETKMTSLVE